MEVITNQNIPGTDSPPERSQGLANQLSSPYEVPHFPIEQIETKLQQ